MTTLTDLSEQRRGPVCGAPVGSGADDGETAAPIPGVSYSAYGTPGYGVGGGAGDVDGDGVDEIITAPGPSATFGAHVRAWDYDGETVTEVPGCSFFAWTGEEARYGARVFADANLDGNGGDELVVGGGPGPALVSTGKVFT